jgi:hypothetical protein
MRILFDHGTPAPLIPFPAGHTVTKAIDAGWDRLVNGELLKAAENGGFEVLLTTDKNMVSRQNLKTRKILAKLRTLQGQAQQHFSRPYLRSPRPGAAA